MPAICNAVNMLMSDNSEPLVQPEVYSRDQHNISRKNIDPDALKIMYRLIRHGYKAYLVGGGVRDLLLKKRPKDFDIATDATPRRVKALFRNSRIIGRRFKLVHVLFGRGKAIEVATFRDAGDPIGVEDGEDDNGALLRRDNVYGTERTDAYRRDVTINALFYNLSDFSIIDYVGGMRDLADEVIRVIGDPNVRYMEDPVRMLRVVRHAARNDFSIEENAWLAIGRHHKLLLKSSAVRVFEELKKDFASGYLLKMLTLLSKTDLVSVLLPELAGRSELLDRRDSALIRLLSAVDEQAGRGTPLCTAAILVLIAVGLRDNGLDEPAEFFSDAADLKQHCAQSFSALAVPRREREKMEGMVQDWFYLARTPPDQIKLHRLKRREYLKDLCAMLRIFEISESLISRLEEPGTGKEREQRRQFGGRHRSPRRYRYPRQR